MKSQETTATTKFAKKGTVKTLKVSITMPEMSGLRFILVPAREDGKVDGTLFNLLDKKWKNVKAQAKGWHSSRKDFKLGSISDFSLQSDVWCVYLLILDKDGEVNQAAVEYSMKKLQTKALYERASIHVDNSWFALLPNFKELAQTYFTDKGISVCYYEEPGSTTAVAPSVVMKDGVVMVVPTMTKEVVETAPDATTKVVVKDGVVTVSAPTNGEPVKAQELVVKEAKDEEGRPSFKGTGTKKPRTTRIVVPNTDVVLTDEMKNVLKKASVKSKAAKAPVKAVDTVVDALKK